MYNGIGLPTPRGTGTNGYVQRNLSFTTNLTGKSTNQTLPDLKKSDDILFKPPNKDILLHEKKRKIEVKCFELEEMMEEKGYTPSEIAVQVAFMRKQLLDRDKEDEPTERLIWNANKNSITSSGGPKAPAAGSHETAAIAFIKNVVFKSALGINESFEDGSSLRQASARKTLAAENQVIAEAQKQIMVSTSPNCPDAAADTKPNPEDAGEKKKKRKLSSCSSPSEMKRRHSKRKGKSHSRHSHHSKKKKNRK